MTGVDWIILARRLQPIGCQHHIVPIGDWRDHDLEPTCWCRPVEDDEEPGLWGHNALDDRLAYERGEKRLS